MKIACLGWGALIWDTGSLPIQGDWNTDGPLLPIEFARESEDGRITLVISPVETHVTTLWASMSTSDIITARQALAKREKIPDRYIQTSIGFWERKGSSHGKCSEAIARWANQKNIDAVVWTNLTFGFKNRRDVMPTFEQVAEHLDSLDSEARSAAEKYVRKAPMQIDTPFRRNFQKLFCWNQM